MECEELTLKAKTTKLPLRAVRIKVLAKATNSTRMRGIGVLSVKLSDLEWVGSCDVLMKPAMSTTFFLLVGCPIVAPSQEISCPRRLSLGGWGVP
jgi:hypothetical protein